MKDNAASLGTNQEALIVAGVPAGAGITARLALLNRDWKSPSLFAQLLMCPSSVRHDRELDLREQRNRVENLQVAEIRASSF